MLVKASAGRLEVIRCDNDPRIYKETQFFHELKNHLNEWHSFDLVKKLMHKDGHLVDDNQYYLRDRKWGFCIYDGAHAVRKVYEPYNDGFVVLNVHTWDKGSFILEAKGDGDVCTG